MIERKYQDQIKFIYQISRNQDPGQLTGTLLSFLKLDLKKYTTEHNVLIGVDMVGHEKSSIDLDVLANAEVVNLMQAHNLGFYLHGGEMIETNLSKVKQKDFFVTNAESIIRQIG